jgi:hypothetical protein
VGSLAGVRSLTNSGASDKKKKKKKKKKVYHAFRDLDGFFLFTVSE